jgi:trehalose 6-phosphate phosphatase
VPLPAALAPLAERPSSAAVFLDFDGTLSPIVPDPATARPLPGVVPLLSDLGRTFGLVAVVSGRPAGFLGEHLDHPAGVRLIGLYGLEEVGHPAGPTVEPGDLARWRPVIDELATRAERDAPAGVSVERKSLGFTLHYRAAPERALWVEEFARRAVGDRGVHLQPGRMAVEFRAGVDVDKGTVVGRLARGSTAACCFGDDLGDLAAFEALAALADDGVAVARVAVADDESPPVVADAADIVVAGPSGALALLRELLAAVG